MFDINIPNTKSLISYLLLNLLSSRFYLNPPKPSNPKPQIKQTQTPNQETLNLLSRNREPFPLFL